MKKQLLTLSILALFTSATKAQQLPTFDFESWTGTGNNICPVSWDQVNNAAGAAGAFLGATCFKETTNPHGGTACIRLKSVTNPIGSPPAVNGIATTGTINTSSQNIGGGQAFTRHPDSLVGYYKYTPTGADMGTIEVVLRNGTTDTVGWARFVTPNATVTNWTRFSVPVVYRNANTIANEVALLSASNGYNGVVGSQIIVDDLSLIYNPSGIKTFEISDINVFSYKNEVIVDMRNVRENDAKLDVYSITGELITSQLLKADAVNNFELANQAAGIYVYKVSTATKVKTGKVLIQ